MGIEILWDEHKNIVIYEFDAVWTWDEVYAAVEEAIETWGPYPERVDTVIQLNGTAQLPPKTLHHLNYLAAKQLPNFGLAVCITSDPFVHTIFNVGIRAHKRIAHYFRIATSPQEAYSLIEQDRQERGSNVMFQDDRPMGV